MRRTKPQRAEYLEYDTEFMCYEKALKEWEVDKIMLDLVIGVRIWAAQVGGIPEHLAYPYCAALSHLNVYTEEDKMHKDAFDVAMRFDGPFVRNGGVGANGESPLPAGMQEARLLPEWVEYYLNI